MSPRPTVAEEPEVNGAIGRAQALAQVLNSLVIAPAVLLYVGLVASGYLPFRPLDAIATDLAAHRAEVQVVVKERQQTERQLVDTLTRLVAVVERMDRRDRLVECQRFADSDIRRRCME